eukprot:Partr_v1_DN25567_c0_g1_i3_m20921 putative lactation elevated
MFSWKGGPSSQHSPLVDNVPRGLYLYGDVGTGKTMLMDLFYHSIPHERKRRVHFNKWMLDVHARSHRLKLEHKQQFDPIPSVAVEMVSEAWLLCFDEFQVTDIADAMILRRLMDELWRLGMVMFTTSNRHPDELYKNGIQRDSFIPCIEAVKAKCSVYNLDSGTDYRKIERAIGQAFFSRDSKGKADVLFEKLCGDTQTSSRTLQAFGRDIHIPLQSEPRKVCRFNFHDFSRQSMSAADYLEIVKHYDVLFIDDLPQLSIKYRDQARRFITLIDVLYENKIKVVCTSDVELKDLFLIDAGDDPSNGDEEIFAFRRSMSRLIQMQSEEWLQLPHK